MAILLFLLLVGAFAVIVVLALDLHRARTRGQELDDELRTLAEDYSKIKAQHERMSKYKGIADADAKAEELLRAAQSGAEQARQSAEAVVADAKARAKVLHDEAEAVLRAAKQEALKLLDSGKEEAREAVTHAQRDAAAIAAEARQKAKSLRDEAQATLDAATLQAWRITEDAHKQAEEIAGSAYEAMRNASLYEQTAKAMKNIIDGYGNRYVVPGHSLLDDLAEDVGYSDVVQELKRARERSRAMIGNGTAARCDYVEDHRRETAISFVLDAFNGKVDSILSRVKHDNHGQLEQEIRDAFTLVNYNGKAFRDARITDEYLLARLAELRWAATAQQMKLDEREEQRRIREQIREEEKARKEFERAMREAAREEELLKKAMETARLQVEQATAEQKAKYEEQLKELAAKLREAEERNQRAMSMAQQTRKGHVYIVSNVGSFGEDVYKIGLTRRLEPLDRIRELGDSSVPFEFDVHALILSDDAPALERQLHKHFVMAQVNKVNHRKEFFRVTLKQIREEVAKLGIHAKWTILAEAREYRETLAIERAIQDDPAKREAWLQRQLELDPAEIAESEVVAEAVGPQ